MANAGAQSVTWIKLEASLCWHISATSIYPHIHLEAKLQCCAAFPKEFSCTEHSVVFWKAYYGWEGREVQSSFSILPTPSSQIPFTTLQSGSLKHSPLGYAEQLSHYLKPGGKPSRCLDSPSGGLSKAFPCKATLRNLIPGASPNNIPSISWPSPQPGGSR